MSKAELLEGVFPPLTTPFSDRGEILFGAFENNLRRYLQTACSGFLLLGSNGEAPHLNEEEKLDLVRRTLDLLPADRRLLVGVNSPDLAGCLKFIEKLHGFRIEALLISVPNYYRDRMDHDSLGQYYSHVADHSPTPVLLYNVPQYSGVELAPDLVAELSEHPKVAGMKDSSGNLVYLERVLGSLRNSEFQILLGSASILGPGVALGIQAAIVAIACPLPELVCSLMEDCRRRENIQESQLRLREMTRELGAYGLPGIKYAMDLMGFCGESCRLPLQPLKTSHREHIAKYLESLAQPVQGVVRS